MRVMCHLSLVSLLTSTISLPLPPPWLICCVHSHKISQLVSSPSVSRVGLSDIARSQSATQCGHGRACPDAMGPTLIILAMTLSASASPPSLTSQGWSQSPVTDEDRRRLVGSFVRESEASEAGAPPASVIDTDPVLGEVIRQPHEGEARQVRRPDVAESEEEGGVLQGFFVDESSLSEDSFSTNFEADSEPSYEASEDLEQLIEYQYDYQEDQEAQEQLIHHAAHQHHQPQPHPLVPPQHVGIGRHRRSMALMVP